MQYIETPLFNSKMEMKVAGILTYGVFHFLEMNVHTNFTVEIMCTIERIKILYKTMF